MLPEWAPPCGNQCTQKFVALTQIPWRVFVKKGCAADGDTWEACLEQCDEICYKDPVLKDQQWSAYIDRSPGASVYSQNCFHACVAGCGYKVCSHLLCYQQNDLLNLIGTASGLYKHPYPSSTS